MSGTIEPARRLARKLVRAYPGVRITDVTGRHKHPRLQVEYRGMTRTVVFASSPKSGLAIVLFNVERDVKNAIAEMVTVLAH